MSLFNENEKTRVSDAIAAAERKTSGEFVAVVAHASADYLFFPMLWAAIAALIVPGVLLIAAAELSLLAVYAIQIGVFVFAGLLCLWPPVRIRLVPRSIRRERSARAAHEQFYLNSIHRTREHSGVLLFVSVAERYVEIVADEGIHAKVGKERWQEIVDAFVADVKAEHVIAGLVTATDAIGEAMAVHYPRAEDDVNELSNRLIEL